MKTGWRELQHRRFEGSFTLEAVFIVPIVLFILFAVIDMSFYLHDQCVLHSVSDQLVFELCHVREKETGRKEVIYEDAQEQSSVLGLSLSREEKQRVNEVLRESLKQRLFISQYSGCEITILFHRLTLISIANARIPMPFLKMLLPGQEIKVCSSGSIHDPAMTVRYEKMIYEEFERTKISTKLQELIEKVEDYIK